MFFNKKNKVTATKQKIKDELKNVIYPNFKKSIVAFGFVKNITLNKNSAIISLEISSALPNISATLKKDIIKNLDKFNLKLQIDISTPKPPQEQQTLQKENPLKDVKDFIMVSSGKGGVGKSTVSTNLAVALGMQGYRVGLLDCDIYGPNIPRMVGIENTTLKTFNSKVVPFETCGIKVMSMGFLIEEGQALIWRGAMIQKAINQLLHDISWGELDYLVIDMPPGTGDAQLTLAQLVNVSCGVSVTTPQQVALDDAKRSIEMFSKIKIPLAGIIENMSGFVCNSCGDKTDIFGKNNSDKIAKEYKTNILGKIALDIDIVQMGDNGKPIVFEKPEHNASKEFLKIASKITNFVKQARKNGLIDDNKIEITKK
jgi:ATP-binding protein involved in chromosome partitioning